VVQRQPPDLAPNLYRIVIVLGVLALVVLRLRDGTANLVDDAYLTLRNARNVAEGFGLVYNPGETVLGTTTPLFAILHGLIGGLLGARWIPLDAVVINAIADTLAFILLVGWIAEAAGSRIVGLAAGAAYAFAPRAIEYSSGGMEAPVYTLLILVALREAARGHEVISGGVSGLALVCRPDGLVVGFIALAWLAASTRRVPWRFLAAGTLVSLPWLVYASLVYPWGPVPQSVVAKMHRPWILPRVHATGALWFQLAAAGFGRPFIVGAVALGKLFDLGRGSLLAAGALTYGVNILLILIGARRLGRAGILLLGFGAGYLALFAVGNPLMLGWYQVPLEPVLAALLAAAMGTIRSSRVRYAALAILVAIPLGVAVAARDHWTSMMLHERWDKRRERAYFAVAERLRPVIGHGSTVMGSENGAIGWALEGRVLDTIGLITPGAERFYPIPPSQAATNMAVPPPLVLAMRPDFFVSLEIFIRRSCLADPAFLAAYELDDSLSDQSETMFDSHGLLVFRRKDHQRS
jgi:hypothetical protein